MITQFLTIEWKHISKKFMTIDYHLNIYFLTFIWCFSNCFIDCFDVYLFRITNQTIQIMFIFKLVINQILKYWYQFDYQIIQTFSHSLTFQFFLYILTQSIKKYWFQILLIFFNWYHFEQFDNQFSKLFLVMIINQSKEKQLLIKFCWLFLYQFYENIIENYQFQYLEYFVMNIVIYYSLLIWFNLL